jgi:hypothetical protein
MRNADDMSTEPKGDATGRSGTGPIPGTSRPGDHINWDSETVQVQLTIELPFWLLVPNGSVNLTIGNCTVRATVINDGVQFSLGHHQSVSQQKTVFLGSLDDAAKASTRLVLLTEGGRSRLTKTLVTFEASAHSDAIEALKSKDKKYQQGCQYFRSLAIAHLDYLNLLINSYRRLSSDPFASEVTAWDVPIWSLAAEGIKFNVILFPYLAHEYRPSVAKFSKPSEFKPYIAAALEDIERIADIDAMPGEVELLDGWSLYYRGRHADSITSFVTAIEVLLEARLREVLRTLGATPEKVEKTLWETRNKFMKRLDQYCYLTQSRVPGPFLHVLPTINGVRLEWELEQTRDLRHKIVHAGQRLDRHLVRPMNQVAETMTWLFDWLSEGKASRLGVKRPSVFYEAGREGFVFDFRLETGGVNLLPKLAGVADPQGEDSVFVIDSPDPATIPETRFLSALGGGGKPSDIELFAKMAFAKLRIPNLGDTPPVADSPLPHHDRYYIWHDGKLMLIFLLDLESVLGERDVEQIGAAVAARTRGGLSVGSVLVIINDQNGMAFEMRVHETISENCQAIAEACGIGLVKAEDLARLALGVQECGWPAATIIEDLVAPGWNGRAPAEARKIGVVVHYYARPSAAIIELNGDTMISLGDFLVFRLRRRFYQHEITEMRQDDRPVERAQFGEVGVTVSLNGAKLPIRWDVYWIPKRTDPGGIIAPETSG